MSGREDARTLEAAEKLLSRDLSGLPMPSRAQEADLLARLPHADADAPVMVSRSIRWPVELETQIKEAAEDAGVSTSEWIRQAAKATLASREKSTLISLEDALRALQNLPHTA